MIDIDNFKQINDTYGHDVGDKVLQRTSAIFKKELLTGEFVGRWGGDEFLFYLTCKKEHRIEERVRNILLSVSNADWSDLFTANGIHITLSGGIVLIEDLIDERKMLKAADIYLYESKLQGRNQVQIGT